MSTDTESAVPSARDFLTSLISSIQRPPEPTTGSTTTTRVSSSGGRNVRYHHHDDDGDKNPLQDLKGQGKNLFLTLHVLFPNELLPALDLLDRRLVTRLDAAPAAVVTARSPNPPPPPTSTPSLRDILVTEDSSDAQQRPPRPVSTTRRPRVPPIYYVRSAQNASHQHRHSATAASSSSSSSSLPPTGPTYEVRLDAWNCSCPAFAFAAFPALIPPSDDAHDDVDDKPADTTIRRPRLPTSTSTQSTAVAGQHHDVHPLNKDTSPTHPGWIFGGSLTRIPDTDANVHSPPPPPRRTRHLNGKSLNDVEDEQEPHTTSSASILSARPPICKHLLACVLVEHCPLFSTKPSMSRDTEDVDGDGDDEVEVGEVPRGRGPTERTERRDAGTIDAGMNTGTGMLRRCTVSVQEIAGWAAGWEGLSSTTTSGTTGTTTGMGFRAEG